MAKFDNNINLRKIAILRQKSEVLSHQKVRQNKSPAPAYSMILIRCYYLVSLKKRKTRNIKNNNL